MLILITMLITTVTMMVVQITPAAIVKIVMVIVRPPDRNQDSALDHDRDGGANGDDADHNDADNGTEENDDSYSDTDDGVVVATAVTLAMMRR